IAISSNRRSDAPSPATHCHLSESRWSSNRTSALTTVGFIRRDRPLGRPKADQPPWGAATRETAERGGSSNRSVRRLPAGNQAVQDGGVGCELHLLAQAAVAEQLGDLRQDLQVL